MALSLGWERFLKSLRSLTVILEAPHLQWSRGKKHLLKIWWQNAVAMWNSLNRKILSQPIWLAHESYSSWERGVSKQACMRGQLKGLPDNSLTHLKKQHNRDMWVVFFERDEGCADIRVVWACDRHVVDTIQGQSYLLKLSLIFRFFLARKSVLHRRPSFGPKNVAFSMLTEFPRSEELDLLAFPKGKFLPQLGPARLPHYLKKRPMKISRLQFA